MAEGKWSQSLDEVLGGRHWTMGVHRKDPASHCSPCTAVYRCGHCAQKWMERTGPLACHGIKTLALVKGESDANLFLVFQEKS